MDIKGNVILFFMIKRMGVIWMQTRERITWRRFVWRVTACHMATYFFVGLTALVLLNYKELYVESQLAVLMRPTDSPWVAAGPALQLGRGLLFAAVLWPFREIILKRMGWFKLWMLFIGFAVLGTAGPAPGSIEGMIYTKFPFSLHLLTLPEILLQTFLFSVLFAKWYQRPGRAWNVIMGILVFLITLMSLAGVFLRR